MKGTKTGKSVGPFPFCCRYFSCGKRTVISSNLNLEGVRQRYSPQVASRLEEMRSIIDRMEPLVGADYWPYPTYADILFSV